MYCTSIILFIFQYEKLNINSRYVQSASSNICIVTSVLDI